MPSHAIQSQCAYDNTNHIDNTNDEDQVPH